MTMLKVFEIIVYGGAHALMLRRFPQLPRLLVAWTSRLSWLSASWEVGVERTWHVTLTLGETTCNYNMINCDEM